MAFEVHYFLSEILGMNISNPKSQYSLYIYNEIYGLKYEQSSSHPKLCLEVGSWHLSGPSQVQV